MPQPVYWHNPTNCDICASKPGSIMYDAATRRGWGWICGECFAKNGCSLGTGRGQKYEKQSDGRYLLKMGS